MGDLLEGVLEEISDEKALELVKDFVRIYTITQRVAGEYSETFGLNLEERNRLFWRILQATTQYVMEATKLALGGEDMWKYVEGRFERRMKEDYTRRISDVLDDYVETAEENRV